MRVFVGVELDAVLRETVAWWVTEGRRLVERTRVRWVRPEAAHVTLHFLGEVETTAAPALVARLSAPYKTAPFEMTLGGVGLFPRPERPRVVWLGLTTGAGSLQALHRETAERLASVGFDPEARPCTPHVTLGRVRGSLRRETVRALTELGGGPRGRGRVRGVTLFESRTGPEGSTYTVLATGRCGG